MTKEDIVIPCLDLKRQQQSLKKEMFQLFEQVYEQTAFSGGPFVEGFEKAFASYCGTAYAIGVSNGTIALHLAMLALNIGPGDEVIVPANTFIATAWGVSHAGAKPVFVDCKADTWEIDAEAIERSITANTKAVIGVHLYGQPFDVDAVAAICEKHNLYLIEDAAQAQGSLYKDKKCGSLAKIATFSFYPGKNLGACGEAGGLTTNDKEIYERLCLLRNHGMKVRYYHEEIGYNYRMGGLEGASLDVKLKYLDQWNQARRAIAGRYFKEITNNKITMQVQPEWAESNFHLFVVTTEDREGLMAYLKEQGIHAGLHYPVPCHLQQAYADLGYKAGDFPESEYLAAHCISLPMFAEMTEEEISYVIEKVNEY
jgi:dTDP-4-amino-4,6-dideoxygalactose transaminase